jgi:hypothetical protein
VSLVESLGHQLRGVADELPVAELREAGDRLHAAAALFGFVMTESGHAEWLAQLETAAGHLDDAMGSINGVLAGLDTYLEQIGLPGVPVPAQDGQPVAARPGGASGQERPDPVLATRGWWVERVDLLTDHDPDPEHPPQARSAADSNRPEAPSEALRRLVRSGRDAGRDGYRGALLATYPGSGLQVPGLAARALRRVAADLLGHAPGPEDHRHLVDRLAGRVRELLPNAPDGLAAGLLAEVAAPFGGRPAGGAPAHPVDAAAAGPILLAAALRATGRDDSQLPDLTQPPAPADHHAADQAANDRATTTKDRAANYNTTGGPDSAEPVASAQPASVHRASTGRPAQTPATSFAPATARSTERDGR